MDIVIEMTVDDEFADEDDDTGLREEAFEALMDELGDFGYGIRIRKRF